MSGGFVGVDVFFVISGFVITRLLLASSLRDGRVKMSTFYRARIRRLLPALTAMLSIVLIASMWIESPLEAQRGTAINGAGAAVWLANLALYVTTAGYFNDTGHSVLLHTWSLAVEEQFYIIFPLFLLVSFWLGRRLSRWFGRGGRRGTVGVAIAGALILSLLINLWLCYSPSTLPAPQALAFFLPMSRAWEFAAGALVAVYFAAGKSPSRAVANASAFVGALLLVSSAFLIDERYVFPGIVVLIPVIGAALLIAGSVTPGTRFGGWLGARPLVAVGDISYSWYLWHWPFIAFAITLWGDSVLLTTVSAALSLSAALVSYRYLEQPIRQGRRLNWQTPRLAFALMLVPLALAFALGTGAGRYWGDPEIRSIATQVTPKSAYACQSLVKISERDLTPCTLDGDPAQPPIYLLGDSNAGQYAEGVALAGEKLSRTVIIATFPGCSMNLVEVYFGNLSSRCLSLVRDAVAWMDEQTTGTVVIASANLYVDEDFGLSSTAVSKTTDPAKKQRAWQTGLVKTFTELSASGHTVVQVRATPHFRDDGKVWRPSECNFILLRNHPEDCGPSQSVTAADNQHRRGLLAEQLAAAETKVPTLDLTPQLCPDGICSVRDGEFWVYREGMHISAGMSKKLAPQFVTALQ